MRLMPARVRRHVAWVACLLLAGCAARVDRPVAPSTALDPPSSPVWVEDMARFTAEDAARPPPAAPVVFTGSSSIARWTTLSEDFAGTPVLNRGFGGSQLRDAVWHAHDVAIRYHPRLIVLYAGDNDIDAGRTPTQVRDDFRAFVSRIRRDLPDVPIDFVSIKPSPARAAELPAQQAANALIRADIARMRDVRYIDVATPMLRPDGSIRAELFGEDRLHMDRSGYVMWRDIVTPYLARSP
jgi:lysophospholipase L1-like esterase